MEELGSVGMNVATMISGVGTLVSEVITLITSNGALTTLFGVGLVASGAKLFKKLVRSAKN